MQYNLIDRIAHGGEYTMEEADLNDLREMVIGILYVIAYIVSAVTFIQWFRRAYYNLHLLVPRLNREEGWAAGSWFVPSWTCFGPTKSCRNFTRSLKPSFLIMAWLTPQTKYPIYRLVVGTLGVTICEISPFVFRCMWKQPKKSLPLPKWTWAELDWDPTFAFWR